MQNEIVNFFHLIQIHCEFISYNAEEIVFILFNTSSGFIFQFEACLKFPV